MTGQHDDEYLPDDRDPGTPNGLDEEIEESYDAPERPLAMNRFGTTAQEYATGESLTRRLSEEEPEVWEEAEAPAEDPVASVEDEDIDVESGRRPAGRLVAGEGGGFDDPEDVWARRAGSGDDESSEEAAMHVIDGE